MLNDYYRKFDIYFHFLIAHYNNINNGINIIKIMKIKHLYNTFKSVSIANNKKLES